MITMQTTKARDYMSLYDYLGRPAGSALGYAIATRAKKRKEVIHYRNVPESPYDRPISLYRADFLSQAFNDAALKEVIEKDVKEYKLKRAAKKK